MSIFSKMTTMKIDWKLSNTKLVGNKWSRDVPSAPKLRPEAPTIDLMCDGFALDNGVIETNVFDFILDQAPSTPDFGKQVSLGSVATQLSNFELDALPSKYTVGQPSDMMTTMKRNVKHSWKAVSVLDFLQQETSKRCKLEALSNVQESFDSLTKV